jgi:putative endonuclease
MAMMRRQTGMLGEKLACDFLGNNGYEIVTTNYRCPDGEMDIIARQQEALVFIEVRTKKSGAFGSPEESITNSKKEKLRNIAVRYLQELDTLPAVWRIDVVAVEMDRRGKATRIEIIENAVEDAD